VGETATSVLLGTGVAGALGGAVVARAVWVGAGVAEGSAVGRGVFVGVLVAVGSGVSVGVGVAVSVGVDVAVGWGVSVGAGVWVGAGVFEAAARGTPTSAPLSTGVAGDASLQPDKTAVTTNTRHRTNENE